MRTRQRWRGPVPAAIGVCVAALVTTGIVVAGSADASTAEPDKYALGGPVVEDWFDRAVTSGLGTPPRGGSYTISPQGAPFSVADSSARVTALAPGGTAKALLPSVSAADVEAQWTLTLAKVPTAGSGLYSATELRYQSSASSYRSKAIVGLGGKVTLAVSRVLDGKTETSLGSVDPKVVLAAGQKLRIQTRIAGTDPVALVTRSWIDGTAAPAWQLRVADEAPARIAGAGAVALWSYASAAGPAMTFSYSSWTATALTAPDSPPGPSVPPSSPTASPTGSPTASPTASPPSSPPSSPPTTSPPSTGSAGSVPVGTAAYAVPANALFVSPGGSDSAAGTQAAPLKTLKTALAKAATGTTIVLRAGSYHESLNVTKAVTIQAYPREAVWFDGSSVVSGWTQHGSTWVHAGWTNQFDHSASYRRGFDDPTSFVNPAYPMAAWPDAVWVGGVQLRQVPGPADVTAGTFAVDYAAQTLTVGTNPLGAEVRSADLSTATTTSADNVVLQGFGLRRYGTAIWQLGTVRLARNGNVARNLVVQDSATTGISYSGAGRADHVTVTGAGMLGIHGNQADGLVISNSIVNGNNREHFNLFPVAGGIKITRSRNLTITGNIASNNVNSTGIWLDESVVGFTITGNSAIDNTQGIEVEISDTGVVANNEMSGGQRGLYIYNTGNVKVFNNSFAEHREVGAYLSQDARRQATHPVGRDPRMPVPDPSCPWLLRNITFANNVFAGTSGGGLYQFYALDKRTGIPADQMNLTVTGNVFNPRVAGNDPYMVGWGGNDNVTVARYATPEALNAAKGKNWQNVLTPSARPTREVVQQVAAANAAKAVPLPADVAAAIGRTAGTLHIGRF